jgi:beta-lactamase class A
MASRGQLIVNAFARHVKRYRIGARAITTMTDRSGQGRRFGAMALSLLMAGCGAGSGSSPVALVPPPPSTVSRAIPPVQQRAAPTAPRALQAQVDQLIRGFPGKAGAAIRAVDDGWTVSSGGDLSLPQQSVSKLWVALTVLAQRDAGRLKLDDPVLVTRDDLTLFHQPIAMLVKGEGYHTTITELLFRALTRSDNTANDRLLTFVGGPRAVRAVIAEKQLGAIHFGPGERLLQSGTAGVTWDQSMSVGGGFEAARARLSPEVRQAALQRYIDNPPDGATPLAIADALARLARGELLSETSTRLFLSTMASSITGRARLRAAVPAGWQVAHKTGTGQDLGRRNAGFNDVGLVTAPDGRRYTIAVMIGDTTAPMRERQMLIQNVCSALTGAHPNGTITETATTN